MKKKKLVAGVTVMALMLSTAITVYAVEAREINLSAQYQDKNFVGNSLRFNELDDETELPEGVKYVDEISIDSDEASVLE